MLGTKFNTYLDITRSQSEKYGHKDLYIFLSDGEDKIQSITYAEFLAKVQIIASNLQANLNQGDRVLILCPPGIEFNVSFIGCLFAGAIPVPLYPPDTRSVDRVINIIDDCSAKAAIANNITIEKINNTLNDKNTNSPVFFQALRKIKLFDFAKLEIETGTEYHIHEPSPEEVAYLQYTSGSTSKPKGVMVTHQNMVYNSHYIADYFCQTDNDIDVSWIPPFHDMGLIKDIVTTISTGTITIFMSPYSFLRKPFRWLKAISKYSYLGEVIAGGPNFAYDLCVNAICMNQFDELDLSNWRIAYNGSEPVRASTLNNFYETFKVCGFQKKALEPVYGLAEATLMVGGPLLSNEPLIRNLDKNELKNNKVRYHDDLSEKTLSVPCCGKIIKEQTTLIVNPDTLKACNDNEVGEIWVKGISVTAGYYNNDEETNKTFHARLSDSGDSPYLRTGDLGFIENGRIYITGRLKDVIIINGYNHYPQDLELTTYQSHDALRSNCGIAFSVTIEDSEKLVIVSEIKRSALRKVDINEVKEKISQAIFHHHSLPVHEIVLVESSTIPKTSSGKLQRKLCKKQYLENALKEIHCLEKEMN